MAWQGNPNNKVPNFIQFDAAEKSEAKKSVNRAEETRRDTDTQKDIVIGIETVDTAILRQIEKFQLTVPDNGATIKVPTYYASPEKWKSIQKDGFMRDYQGKVILPAVVFSRTTSEKNQKMMLFNRYLDYTVLKKYDPKNKYTPFNVLIGQNVPINDVYGMRFPDHMIFTYHFIIWAEYQAQINKLVERFNYEAEDFWGDKYGYRFQVKLDSISHTIQLATDADRMVKAEFDLQVFGYIVPDVIDTFDGKKNTTQKWLTPKKVIMGIEVVQTGFDPNIQPDNEEKWRNQNYPNLQKDVPIPAPPIVFNDISTQFQSFEKIIQVISVNIQNNNYHFPAPTSSSDTGEEGWLSYDNDYYYIYTDGQWKRVPIALFNALNTF